MALPPPIFNDSGQVLKLPAPDPIPLLAPIERTFDPSEFAYTLKSLKTSLAHMRERLDENFEDPELEARGLLNSWVGAKSHLSKANGWVSSLIAEAQNCKNQCQAFKMSSHDRDTLLSKIVELQRADGEISMHLKAMILLMTHLKDRLSFIDQKAFSDGLKDQVDQEILFLNLQIKNFEAMTRHEISFGLLQAAHSALISESL